MANSVHLSLRRGLLAATLLASPLLVLAPGEARAQMAIAVSITLAPPLLPVYAQPPMPEMGYVWTPGYWAYDNAAYYWVPGAWVLPPEVGYLWTPPYWGWSNGFYVFNRGYWGQHVGFYGGVNYGYGYGGEGYDGGRWKDGHFEYNRAANNFGAVQVTNAYQQNLTVVNRTNVSYAGGNGGLHAVPSAQDHLADHDDHIQAAASQERHVSTPAASQMPASRALERPTEPGNKPAVVRPEQHEAAPTRPEQQVARPAASTRPEQQAARPEAPARQHVAEQVSRPAPARPAEHAAAPDHQDHAPQKQ
jgi:hypothetical protein